MSRSAAKLMYLPLSTALRSTLGSQSCWKEGGRPRGQRGHPPTPAKRADGATHVDETRRAHEDDVALEPGRLDRRKIAHRPPDRQGLDRDGRLAVGQLDHDLGRGAGAWRSSGGGSSGADHLAVEAADLGLLSRRERREPAADLAEELLALGDRRRCVDGELLLARHLDVARRAADLDATGEGAARSSAHARQRWQGRAVEDDDSHLRWRYIWR